MELAALRIDIGQHPVHDRRAAVSGKLVRVFPHGQQSQNDHGVRIGAAKGARLVHGVGQGPQDLFHNVFRAVVGLIEPGQGGQGGARGVRVRISDAVPLIAEQSAAHILLEQIDQAVDLAVRQIQTALKVSQQQIGRGIVSAGRHIHTGQLLRVAEGLVAVYGIEPPAVDPHGPQDDLDAGAIADGGLSPRRLVDKQVEGILPGLVGGLGGLARQGAVGRHVHDGPAVAAAGVAHRDIVHQFLDGLRLGRQDDADVDVINSAFFRRGQLNGDGNDQGGRRIVGGGQGERLPTRQVLAVVLHRKGGLEALACRLAVLQQGNGFILGSIIRVNRPDVFFGLRF